MDEGYLEQLTVALNRLLYDASVGLPFDEEQADRLVVQLEREYRQALDDPARRDWALDGVADMQSARWQRRLLEKTEQALVVPEVAAGGEAATWHNWRRLERELDGAARRQLFAEMVDKSRELSPLIAERYAAVRQAYAEYGTTPLHVFARREGASPEALRALALDLGRISRAPFRAALDDMARQVFGSDEVGAAEVRALYLNRMYEPLASEFDSRDALADVRGALARLGFGIDHVSIDVQERPTKYAGAFCFPVQIPDDVRVSVRPVSSHHLADMLFHEFGHAVHFSGIDPTLSFADRYWLHAGTHETIATLFESLLGCPEFLSEVMGLGERAVRRLAAFDRFKHLVTGAWLAAEALTICDAWLENLTWAHIEQRYVQYCAELAGVTAPPGLARLNLYVSRVDVYALGYIVAAARVTHWLEELQSAWGTRWWASGAERAGRSIRERIRLGGLVKFDGEWLEAGAYARRVCAA